MTHPDSWSFGYGVNGLNQYTQIDGQGMSYDAAGNLTSDGAGFTYTYDMENRLVATAGTRASTLAYDTLGRLKRTSIDGITTNFHYDGDALVGEYVSGALQRRYVHGDQVDEPLVQYNLSNVGPSYRRYLHADHQGSIIAHSENGGTTLSINKYDPYGISASGNYGRFGYTGQAWLENLGLNYYKARIYSPRIGRFLQTDPIGYEDDYNLYAYVGNDPVNRFDPSGTQQEQPPPQPLPPAETSSPYEEDGVTLKPIKDGAYVDGQQTELKPIENGQYVDGQQKVLKDTTGLGAKSQAIVEAVQSRQDANDRAATARANGDDEAQRRAEYVAEREKTRFEKLTIPSNAPLVIHPDGSTGGDSQEGDVWVPR